MAALETPRAPARSAMEVPTNPSTRNLSRARRAMRRSMRSSMAATTPSFLDDRSVSSIPSTQDRNHPGQRDHPRLATGDATQGAPHDPDRNQNRPGHPSTSAAGPARRLDDHL